MLSTNGADPLYLQLCNQLRSDIEKGKLSTGQRLLSERRLAAELGISRITVRMALQRLQEQGFVVIDPCKGAYVL